MKCTEQIHALKWQMLLISMSLQVAPSRQTLAFWLYKTLQKQKALVCHSWVNHCHNVGCDERCSLNELQVVLQTVSLVPLLTATNEPNCSGAFLVRLILILLIAAFLSLAPRKSRACWKRKDNLELFVHLFILFFLINKSLQPIYLTFEWRPPQLTWGKEN